MIETILAIISGLILLIIISPIWILVLVGVGIVSYLVFALCIVLVSKLLWLGWKLCVVIFFGSLVILGALIAGGATFYLAKYFKMI